MAEETDKTFDDYFDEAMGDTETVEDEKKEEKEEETEQKTESDEQNQESEESGDQDETVFNSVPQEKEGVDNSNQDTPGQTDQQIDYKALYEKELQRTKSWEGRIKASNDRVKQVEQELNVLKAQKEKPRTGGQAPSPDGTTGKEDEIIQGFIEEFPDLEKPIMAMASKIANRIVDDKLKILAPQVETLKSSVAEAQVDKHFQAIDIAHPDWRKIVETGALDTWIDAQPTFVKETLNQIKERGNAAQVIEMLSAFKKSFKQPNQPNQMEQPAPAPPLKAKRLLAVPAQSGGPRDTRSTAPSKDDFDAAWKEAVSSR